MRELKYTTVANVVGQDYFQLLIPCPVGKRVRLLSVSFNFITDATVATRDMVAQIDYGAKPNVASQFRLSFPGASVPESCNCGVTFSVRINPAQTTSLSQGSQVRELPEFWSDRDIGFAYDCPNMQAADQLTNVFVSWECEDS